MEKKWASMPVNDSFASTIANLQAGECACAVNDTVRAGRATHADWLCPISMEHAACILTRWRATGRGTGRKRGGETSLCQNRANVVNMCGLGLEQGVLLASSDLLLN